MLEERKFKKSELTGNFSRLQLVCYFNDQFLMFFFQSCINLHSLEENKMYKCLNYLYVLHIEKKNSTNLKQYLHIHV